MQVVYLGNDPGQSEEWQSGTRNQGEEGQPKAALPSWCFYGVAAAWLCLNFVVPQTRHLLRTSGPHYKRENILSTDCRAPSMEGVPVSAHVSESHLHECPAGSCGHHTLAPEEPQAGEEKCACCGSLHGTLPGTCVSSSSCSRN